MLMCFVFVLFVFCFFFSLFVTLFFVFFFFFQAEDGIRDHCVTGVQTCALPIWGHGGKPTLVFSPCSPCPPWFRFRGKPRRLPAGRERHRHGNPRLPAGAGGDRKSVV